VRHLTYADVARNASLDRDQKPDYEVTTVTVDGRTHHELHVTESELHEMLGKDLAESAIKESSTWDVGETQRYGELRGMQVGLKGLTDLYDKKIPQYVKKLVKKYGVTPKLSGNEFRVVERVAIQQQANVVGPPTEVKSTVFDVVSGEGADQKFHGEFNNRNMAEQMIRDNDDRVWYIDITPEMREDILKEGLPLTFQEHKTSGRYV
jgi:hypothetical protein